MLTTVFEQVGKHVLDPALYLGILLHRLGRPQDALHTWPTPIDSTATVRSSRYKWASPSSGAGGDSGLALRSAAAPWGTAAWACGKARPAAARRGPKKPLLCAWVEAFPEARSYVRRLATRYRYVCPLLGSDLSIIVRQGQLALAQAFYRQDRFQESADLYGKLLQDSPPTVLLLRGYGLSLARLGQHDRPTSTCASPWSGRSQRSVHRRLSRPVRCAGQTDQLRRQAEEHQLVAPAVSALPGHGQRRMDRPDRGSPRRGAEGRRAVEPGRSTAAVRQPGLGPGDRSAGAALAYSHLAGTYPDAVRPIYAWLYARAATLHGITGPHDLDLFARTFQDVACRRGRSSARNKWDLAEVEYTYLERSSQLPPDSFPPSWDRPILRAARRFCCSDRRAGGGRPQGSARKRWRCC